MNKIKLKGIIKSEIEIKTKGKKDFCQFYLEVEAKGKNNFIPCLALEENARLLDLYFKKGSTLEIEGELEISFKQKNEIWQTLSNVLIERILLSDEEEREAERIRAILERAERETSFEEKDIFAGFNL